jgi:hypothetical protein
LLSVIAQGNLPFTSPAECHLQMDPLVFPSTFLFPEDSTRILSVEKKIPPLIPDHHYRASV